MRAEETKKKKLSVKQYLNKTTQHLHDLINDLKLLEKYGKLKNLCA